ncbi:MAG: competence/damage-inducible protein A [Oscillospiraceae bacterium]|nr:competence/damage-inducible protein A [Oscillospiraceae bacterium]
MTAEIIAVGTELLLGQIANTNAQFLSQKLSEVGVSSYFQTVVGDNPDRLKQALSIASGRADVVITTGGLGPTADDLTKQIIAEFCGLDCVLDEESLRLIEQRFARMGRCMAQNNVKQAEMPRGCIILKNNHGTAPGAILECNEKIYIMLPGPPFEMKGMFNEHVYDYLAKKTGEIIFSKTLRVFGIGESDLEEKLGEIMNSENQTIAMYAKMGEVTLRLTTKAKDSDEAERLLEPLRLKVCDILGNMVYGEGENYSLQAAVVDLLKSRKLKVSFAESCTGGLVAAKLTAIAGASEVFDGGVVTYSNAQKEKLLDVPRETLEKFGAVSKEVAIAMATGVRKLAGADIGVGVTGIAGPDGGTEEKPVGLVYIGICGADGATEHMELRLAGEREVIRERTAMYALDMVRKKLLTNQKL